MTERERKNSPHACLVCGKEFSDWWGVCIHVRKAHKKMLVAGDIVFLDEVVRRMPSSESAAVAPIARPGQRLSERLSISIARYCAHCDWKTDSLVALRDHLIAEHGIRSDQIRFSRDWYDDELVESRAELVVERFSRQLQIVSTVSDFLQECGVGWDSPDGSDVRDG